MEINLRYCPKCKRDTLQVEKTYFDTNGWVSYSKWAEGVGRKDIEESKSDYTHPIAYCSNCGRHWEIETKTPIPQTTIKEFTQSVKILVL